LYIEANGITFYVFGRDRRHLTHLHSTHSGPNYQDCMYHKSSLSQSRRRRYRPRNMSGNWCPRGTSQEMRQITRGLEPLRIVGVDIGGLSPSYNDTGETTAPAASDLAFEISIRVKNQGFEGPKAEIGEPRPPQIRTRRETR